MRSARNKLRLIHLLLTAFLVAAQWGALVHALEHDVGTPQNQVCTTCVAASQLVSACVDTSVTMESVSPYFVRNTESTKDIKPIHALVARQRGPPTPL